MKISTLAQQLINTYQRGFPLCSRPFLQLAEQFNVSENEVINCLEQLEQSGVLSRLGAVFNHQQAGASTLAALKVSAQKLDKIAAIVTSFTGVNHNYAREHEYNLWFVITASDQSQLEQTIVAIEQATQYQVLVLPMEKSFHIDLAFTIDFEHENKQNAAVKNNATLRVDSLIDQGIKV
ncbi:MAG: Lrp/AsnC family transcriptional regulator [Alteromonadaceae bacterium]|nr:Lrp/AsnC family transcriptional regulator [Alteromonadaceae bacterium]